MQGGMPGNGFRPPLRLIGTIVDLVPLSRNHIPQLLTEAQDSEVWKYFRGGPLSDPQIMPRYVEEVLRHQQEGSALSFALWHRAEGRPVGMTRFMDIDRANRTVEIGGTWISRRLWGTGVNVEAKYLMLQYALEEEAFNRVQIKTDVRNLRSQKAIEALGAVREGLLRHQIILSDGTLRDSVYYSILREEWPAVREHLLARLASHRSPPAIALHA